MAAGWAQPPPRGAGLPASPAGARRRLVQLWIPRCARARTQTRPRRAAVSARHQIGNKTLAARCPAPGPGPELRPECGGRLSTVLHPHFPDRTGGAGATYRWARPPGPPRVPGGSAARSPWGERETVDRRRAPPRRRLCGERQAARLGRGGRGA